MREGRSGFVSTHSPEFLNGLKLEEIYWLGKEDGYSTIRRCADSDILNRLVDEGDLPGALWRQGRSRSMVMLRKVVFFWRSRQ